MVMIYCLKHSGPHWFYELKRCDSMILRINNNRASRPTGVYVIDSYLFLLVHTSSHRIRIASPRIHIDSSSPLYCIALPSHCILLNQCTVVPALGDPRRERPPAACGHFVNVPTHFKVKLPVIISGHLPNADAVSHLLVVSTCYNGQCKQMPRFRWSFQPKIAGAHPNLRPTDLSNFRVVVW